MLLIFRALLISHILLLNVFSNAYGAGVEMPEPIAAPRITLNSIKALINNCYYASRSEGVEMGGRLFSKRSDLIHAVASNSNKTFNFRSLFNLVNQSSFIEQFGDRGIAARRATLLVLDGQTVIRYIYPVRLYIDGAEFRVEIALFESTNIGNRTERSTPSRQEIEERFISATPTFQQQNEDDYAPMPGDYGDDYSDSEESEDELENLYNNRGTFYCDYRLTRFGRSGG